MSVGQQKARQVALTYSQQSSYPYVTLPIQLKLLKIELIH